MRLYLDSADTKAWDALIPFGFLHGITTNPLLAHRAGHSYQSLDWAGLFGRAADLGAKELHVQVYGSPETYAEWAGGMYAIGAKSGVEAVIKIPLVADALAVYKDVSALSGRILLTACYEPSQALLADALNADFLAPYLGRMRDGGTDDIAALRDMVQVTRNGSCKVLAASIRSKQHLLEVARSEAPCATISEAVCNQLLEEKSSYAAWEEFEKVACL